MRRSIAVHTGAGEAGDGGGFAGDGALIGALLSDLGHRLVL